MKTRPKFDKGSAVTVDGTRGYVLRVFQPAGTMWRYLVQWLQSRPSRDRYVGFVTALDESEIEASEART